MTDDILAAKSVDVKTCSELTNTLFSGIMNLLRGRTNYLQERSIEMNVCYGYPLVAVRPYFGPRQVRTPKGVKVGKEYFEVCLVGEGFRRRIVVLESPYEETPGKWWVRVRFLGTGYEGTISLQDESVTPYEVDCGRFWNPSNYLLRV